MKKAEPGDLTVIYYTANFLEDHNPYFLENTQNQLLKAIGDLPLIIVSQKPMTFYSEADDNGNITNICVGDIGRSHLNIYRQILIGAKAAKTKYVAMAEDDILYSYEHFHSFVPEDNQLLFDMNKLSLFTWSDPMCFSFRHNRKVVNQLIADRQYLIDALEERFKRVDELLKSGMPESEIIKMFGDPGRYEERLGVTKRKTADFMCTMSSIVFSHEHAFGYLNQGEKKKLGDLRIQSIWGWGDARDVAKLFDPNL